MYPRKGQFNAIPVSSRLWFARLRAGRRAIRGGGVGRNRGEIHLRQDDRRRAARTPRWRSHLRAGDREHGAHRLQPHAVCGGCRRSPGDPGHPFHATDRAGRDGAIDRIPGRCWPAQRPSIAPSRRRSDGPSGERDAPKGPTCSAGSASTCSGIPAGGGRRSPTARTPSLLGEMGAALTRGVRSSTHGVRQALRAQLDGERSVPRRRAGRRAGAARGLPAPFQAGHRSGCRVRDERLQLGQRAVGGRQQRLLTDILRDEWNFDGFVMSDFIWGHRDPVGSVAAGLDLEMPFRQQRAKILAAALADGRLDPTDVRVAGERLLRTQLIWAATHSDTVPPRSVVASSEHAALARRAAAQSAVLLRNTPYGERPETASPVRREREVDRGLGRPRIRAEPRRRWKLEGPAAVFRFDSRGAAEASGDRGPARPRARRDDPAGARERRGRSRRRSGRDGRGRIHARHRQGAAKLTPGLAGRLFTLLGKLPTLFGASLGGDRHDLDLKPGTSSSSAAVAAANPRTVVVVIAGSAVTLEEIREAAPAILYAWYPGMEGGNAIADVLFGDAEPEGRLPFVIPTSADHLPHWDPESSRENYDRWWGYRKLDRDRHEPAYPFGFGLGYSPSLSRLGCGTPRRRDRRRPSPSRTRGRWTRAQSFRSTQPASTAAQTNTRDSSSGSPRFEPKPVRRRPSR